MNESDDMVIAGHSIPQGERRRIKVPLGKRVGGNEIGLPIEVVRGRRGGKTLFVCAAVHGDEIGGVEIIRRVLAQKSLRRLRGTLIAVPIVNLYGFLGLTRYLPDRRDLNRSFPGSAHGSLASRLANLFITEVVANSTHGIDLHTGSVHRSNLPQVRACLDDPETARLAHAFGVPVVINANLRDGSLRQAVLERKVPMLLYEGGEALRFDEAVIHAGVRGVLRVMRALEMLPQVKQTGGRDPFVAHSSHWLRASDSGILRSRVRLGVEVQPGDRVGIISDPLGAESTPIFAEKAGVVIGRTELPLVNEGDALFHIAAFDEPSAVASSVEAFREELENPLRDGT